MDRAMFVHPLPGGFHGKPVARMAYLQRQIDQSCIVTRRGLHASRGLAFASGGTAGRALPAIASPRALMPITAESLALLKRLGRRQVLEISLTAGRPIKPIGRHASSNFLWTADFTESPSTSLTPVRVWRRSDRCRLRLVVGTWLGPERHSLRPAGGFGSTPACIHPTLFRR